MIWMPGRSYTGPLPPLTEAQSAVAAGLRRDVEELAVTIGQRNMTHYQGLQAAAEFIEESLQRQGYQVVRQPYEVQGKTVFNVEGRIPGTHRGDEVVVVGAHYDSIEGTVGANDNASGTAGLLALACLLAGQTFERELRFVAFVNEEPPFFQTPAMGSMVYASQSRRNGEKIVAMVALDGIGYYSDTKKSQNYPFPLNLFYPSQGNFIAFGSNIANIRLLRKTVASFRRNSAFPSQGGAMPGFIPEVGWSDHWAFWQHGYPGVMVTDTLPFRYVHYHTAEDTAEKLDYERMARVVTGLEKVVADLAVFAEG